MKHKYGFLNGKGGRDTNVFRSNTMFRSGVVSLLMLTAIFRISPQAFSQPDATQGHWPQWRGPKRNNASTETGLLKQWPEGGPPLLWKVLGLGEGIASVSIAGGRIYTLGYHNMNEYVIALKERTGERIWATRIGPAAKENRLMRWLSQRTPTINGERLYVVTAKGELICLRTVDGKPLWRKSYLNDFEAKKPTWGFCDYPLVDGDKLICTPGGPQAAIVALNKKTGHLIWKSSVPDNQRSAYTAIVVAEVGGIRQYVTSLSGGLVGVAANDGRLLWYYKGSARYAANSYTPIVQGDLVFYAWGYRRGITLLKLVPAGNGFDVKKQYFQEMSVDAFQDSTVLVGDHVYTYQAPDGMPMCVEMKTGTIVWAQKDSERRNKAALMYADGHLYLRRSNGVMTLVEVTPERYIEKGTFSIPDHQQSIGSTFPVVAAGRLYLRDNDLLFCYDVREDGLKQPQPQPKTIILPPLLSKDQSENSVVQQPRTGKDREPDAIFFPTPQDVVEKMLMLANVKKDDVVYDLGCGDGRIVVTAAKKYGCKAVGYEIDPELVKLARENIKQNQVEHLVKIEREDVFTLDLSGADVITVYLLDKLNERLIPQLKKLKPGSRIVSHQFQMPGVKADKVITIESKDDGVEHTLYLWTTPLKMTQR
jgi:outer membrane protein assembly factor BamB